MSDDTTLDTVRAAAEEPHEIDQSMMIKIVAPLATLVVAGVVRRALESGYKRVKGTPPPRAHDRSAPMTQVLLWAAVTATAVAVASVVVDRLVAPHEHEA
jgi:hypothetical protein